MTTTKTGIRPSTLERYRAAAVEVYSQIKSRQGQVNFNMIADKLKVSSGVQYLFKKAGIIEDTGTKGVFKWLYQWPNGVQDWYILARKVIEYQNDQKERSRDRVRAKGKTDKKPTKQPHTIMNHQNGQDHPEGMVNGIEVKAAATHEKTTDFKMKLSKLQGRALLMLLQAVSEDDNPEYDLYRPYIEHISVKILDQIF